MNLLILASRFPYLRLRCFAASARASLRRTRSAEDATADPPRPLDRGCAALLRFSLQSPCVPLRRVACRIQQPLDRAGVAPRAQANRQGPCAYAHGDCNGPAPAGSQTDAEGIMTIRRIAILAVALTALSACKAVTLQEATVSQPTFGIEADDWGVPETDQLRQKGFHAPTPSTHPAAAIVTTQDLHAMLIGPNPPVTINAVFGKNQVTSIPGSVWLPAAGRAVLSTMTSRPSWRRRSRTSPTTISHDRSWSTASTLNAGCPTTPPCASMRSATRTSTGIVAASLRGRQRISHENGQQVTPPLRAVRDHDRRGIQAPSDGGLIEDNRVDCHARVRHPAEQPGAGDDMRAWPGTMKRIWRPDEESHRRLKTRHAEERRQRRAWPASEDVAVSHCLAAYGASPA